MKLNDAMVEKRFQNEVDMMEFLEMLKKTDIWTKDELRKFSIACKENPRPGEPYHLIYGGTEHPIYEEALLSMERLSGGDARGNSKYTKEEYAEMQTTMFAREKPGRSGEFIVRGETEEEAGLVICFHGSRFERMDQVDLFGTFIDYLKSRPHGYTFLDGTYTHHATYANFELPNMVTDSYREAWRNAGFPQSRLNNTKVFAEFATSDIGILSAEVRMYCQVDSAQLLLGNPVSVPHRVGLGGLSEYAKNLQLLDMTIEEEMDRLADMMSTKLIFPVDAMVNAMKYTKLLTSAKKACRELVKQSRSLKQGTSAYTVYLLLNEIVQRTKEGKEMSQERKFMLLTSLRKLMLADWFELDEKTDTNI